mmetsp:Transcript_2158/g.5473  ORF Transcript_2158/g.5473 Transcript_2158/m.5473 type:complete len:466 (+) Transcript_2158:156-1553(+)
MERPPPDPLARMLMPPTAALMSLLSSACTRHSLMMPLSRPPVTSVRVSGVKMIALILLWSRPGCTFLTVVASAGASGLPGAPPVGPTRSQMCSVASSLPAMAHLLSCVMATLRTSSAGPDSVCAGATAAPPLPAPAMSYTHTFLSAPPLTSHFPLCDTASAMTAPVCPLNSPTLEPSLQSHTLSVLSDDPVTSVWWSGQNATALTSPLWPASTKLSLPVLKSNTLTAPGALNTHATYLASPLSAMPAISVSASSSPSPSSSAPAFSASQLRFSLRVAASKTLTSPRSVPHTMVALSHVKATWRAPTTLPLRYTLAPSLRRAASWICHMRSVSSPDADASALPSGDAATPHMAAVCPCSRNASTTLPCVAPRQRAPMAARETSSATAVMSARQRASCTLLSLARDEGCPQASGSRSARSPAAFTPRSASGPDSASSPRGSSATGATAPLGLWMMHVAARLARPSAS